MAAARLQDQDGARVGVVITGRMSVARFLEEGLHALVQLVQAHSANVDVAPIFAALPRRAALQARECLAREMHDGIVQELMALGHRIDSPAAMLRPPPQLALALDGVPVDLSQVLIDLRLRIGGLRPASPDQGLGAGVGARLQRLRTTRGSPWD